MPNIPQEAGRSCHKNRNTGCPAAVIAYSYNVPAVELVWNNKQLMFGQAIGFPERFVPAGGSDVRHLVDLMERA